MMAVMANTNLIMEKLLGSMNVIHVGSQYEKMREEFLPLIKLHEKKIDKTVDLFSRIKNTEQAEEISTVIFTVKKLKGEKKAVSENDVLEYILKWKKNWSEKTKEETVAGTIRNLGMLRWINLEYSEKLPVSDFM
jgi:hypothetical protein